MALGYAKLSYAVSRLGGEAIGTADLVADSGFGLRTLQKDSNCVYIEDPSPVWGLSDFLPRRNLLLATDTLATQNVTVVATAYKLYMQGTGSITLSGTGSGTLNGTGANDRVSLSFTPTAGTLTLTVSGTVTFGMLCTAATIDQSYQKITDWVSEQYAWAAQKQVPWLRRNRFLNTATFSTQTVSSVTANPITVSFTGTGTITFSTAYSGSLVGTGASDRVSVTFTPSAGNLVCTVSGSVTLAQCENASAATAYQPILASWDATYTALAVTAGYPVLIWQDSAGTTAVNGDNQAIGVLRDESSLNLGLELVGNGGFDSDTVWVKGTGWTISGGVASHSGAGAALYQGISVIPGKSYLCSITIISYTSGGFYIGFLGGAGAWFTVPAQVGKYNFVLSAVTGSANIYLGMSSFIGSVDNISVREIPGYTAIQSTAANQPKWRLDANGKSYIERDLVNDALPITFPNLGSDCEIFVGIGATVSEAIDQTLNGSYAPITPAIDYGSVILKTTPPYRDKLIKWLKAKAGY